jgi:DNA-binding NarL/FixJ family response regulator
MNRIEVFVYATDPVSTIGIAAQLRAYPEVRVVGDSEVTAAQVAVLVFDLVDAESVRVVRAVQRNRCPRVLLVVSHLDRPGLLAGIDAGVCGFLRRSQTRPGTLVEAVRSALTGDGTVPADLLGRLLSEVSLVHQQVPALRGMSSSRLSDREMEVLNLLSEGHPTSEVARRLCYSERTVKNVLLHMTRRHKLRNRTHAVAYALRQGLI